MYGINLSTDGYDTHMELKKFGDVVEDGEDDDGENVGPGGPGVGKLQKDVVLIFKIEFSLKTNCFLKFCISLTQQARHG